MYNNDVAADTSALFPDGYPRGYYRNIVIALSFTTAACCLLAAVLGLKMRREEKAEDDKAAHNAPPTGAYASV